jgi:hypothetical protein
MTSRWSVVVPQLAVRPDGPVASDNYLDQTSESSTYNAEGERISTTDYDAWTI